MKADEDTVGVMVALKVAVGVKLLHKNVVEGEATKVGVGG